MIDGLIDRLIGLLVRPEGCGAMGRTVVGDESQLDAQVDSIFRSGCSVQVIISELLLDGYLCLVEQIFMRAQCWEDHDSELGVIDLELKLTERSAWIGSIF